MRMSTWILLLANREGDGVLFDGAVNVDIDEDSEPLVEGVLRELRRRDVSMQAGDTLFFPEAAPGHRFVRVP